MLNMKYFVLKPKGRNAHAVASREAMKTYASYIEAEDNSLAKSLRDWVNIEEDNVTTEKIDIEFDNKTFMYLATTAHELDITFNELCTEILRDYINDVEFDEVDCSDESESI